MVNMRGECERILGEAHRQEVMLRVIGGMAVHLHSTVASKLPSLQRDYGDLDFVTVSPDDQRMRSFFESIGFVGNARFNALQGASRMIFDNQDGSWYIDIFINRFHMCHDIKFSRQRLQQDPLTIPLAELLLTKLQIITINLKDVKDLAALLIEHPLGTTDQETINVSRILDFTSQDWGLYTTVQLNLDRIPGLLQNLALPKADTETVIRKVKDLGSQMESATKTTSWKMRSLIGKAVKWYEEPEDAARGELKLE